MSNLSPKSTALFAIATMVIVSVSIPVFAESQRGKMANEWTVSKMEKAVKPEDGIPEETWAISNGTGSGAGKVNVQDINARKEGDAGVKKKKAGMFLKLGAIKGE